MKLILVLVTNGQGCLWHVASYHLNEFKSLTIGPSFGWKCTKSYQLQGIYPMTPTKGPGIRRGPGQTPFIGLGFAMVGQIMKSFGWKCTKNFNFQGIHPRPNQGTSDSAAGTRRCQTPFVGFELVMVWLPLSNSGSVGGWWRGIGLLVRPPVLAGELSLSCARLKAGRETTLWVNRPLSVSQHGLAGHPSGVG